MKGKFSINKNYKNICLIISPYGMIKEETILSGKQWMGLLVFDVENNFDQMFEVVS